MTNDEATALQRRLGQKFGDHDYYAVVFDPYDVAGEFSMTPPAGFDTFDTKT